MTHVLQSLDQVFSALKKRMERLIHHWHGDPKNAGQKLTQYSMMKHVAYKAFEETFSRKETLRNAFKKTGIFPWNKIQPDIRKLKSGSIYKKNFIHEEVFPFPPGSSELGDTVPAALTATDPPVATASTAAAPPTTALTIAAPPPAASTIAAPVIADPLIAQPLGSDLVPEPEATVIANYAELAAPVSGFAPVPSTSSSSCPSDPMLRESSSSSTATLPSTSTSIVDILLEKQRNLTSRQKERQLQKFEAVQDDEDVERFEELFSKKMFDVPHSGYQAWLQLKQQAIGTEEEALGRVLSSNMPKNISKKKTTRTDDKPKGDARYAPQHPDYYDYFRRCEERSKGKRKVTATYTSADLPPTLVTKPTAATATVPQSNTRSQEKWLSSLVSFISVQTTCLRKLISHLIV